MGLSAAREEQMLAQTCDFKDTATISVVEGELIQKITQPQNFSRVDSEREGQKPCSVSISQGPVSVLLSYIMSLCKEGKLTSPLNRKPNSQPRAELPKTPRATVNFLSARRK